MNLLYTSKAKDDLDIAFEWYEHQRRGLGFDFLDCVEVSVKLILESPEMYKFILTIDLVSLDASLFQYFIPLKREIL